MRCLVLLAVLTTACDQGAGGASPPPEATRAPAVVIARQSPVAPLRFVVRDDADFGVKAVELLGEMGELFADGSKDCELVATRVETFGARNVTRFSVLMDYGKAHPQAETALQGQAKAQTDKLIQQLTPTLTACSSNTRLMVAFKKLADNNQLPQRPR